MWCMCWPRRLQERIVPACYTITLDPGLLGISVHCTSRGAMVVYVPSAVHATLACMHSGDIITHLNGHDLRTMGDDKVLRLLASTRNERRTLRCLPAMCAKV